ncbi:rRNA N6-adenosine-methyltransferase METTL5 [Cylas formicarius]|uniref:rRNA N6-adenosine-methyltransferase METTL5 n=1 Tax=Cylas formicarius TaxID=197179 RepID=UPI0029586E15|nr:rRNA N6-adenosine-methyltransferase METTL5 [Cylas formicarius]
MFPCLKLSKLQELLEGISGFEKPKLLLEQYITPPHLGSHMLHIVQAHYGDITGKIIADLGCGCGGLSVGVALLNAGLVVGFEIDGEALDIFRVNVSEFELVNIDAIQCDVLNISDRFFKKFDTVLMNPPFGTKCNIGLDMKFLEVAFQLSTRSVYSLHKTSTRKHVLKHAASLGAKAEVLAELRYDLPSTYKFHKKTSVDINVDFYRFLIS